MPESEVRLRGGSSIVHRRGDLVLREGRPWSGTVLALLRHLADAGFAAAPRVVEPGFDDRGREMLSFLEGERPGQSGWSDAGAYAVGELLRDLHRATATFVPPPDAVWMPWWGRDLGGSDPIIGHCDVVPWNFLAIEGRPVALVDWDTAGPVDRRWELAQAAWLNAQLYENDADQSGGADVDARAHKLRLIVDGYGLAANERTDLFDAMIEFAIRSAAQESIDGGVTPAGTEPSAMGLLGGGPPLQGHELLWAVTWRTRSAAWMFRHRAKLERALR